LVENQEDRPAVDPARKRDPDRLVFRQAQQPHAHLAREGADVSLADGGEVSRQRLPRWCEKTVVDRIGIGAANQCDFGEVVRRSIALLDDEVPPGDLKRAGHANDVTLPRHQRKLTVDLADSLDTTALDPPASLFDGHVEEGVAAGIGEVEDLVKRSSLDHAESPLLTADRDSWQNLIGKQWTRTLERSSQSTMLFFHKRSAGDETMRLPPPSAHIPAIVTLLAALVSPWCLGCRGDRGDSPGGWEAQRARLDATVWADETLAQEYERTLVSLWDALLAAGRRGHQAGKVAALSAIDFEELTFGTPRRVEALDHGIGVFELGSPHTAHGPAGWAAFLDGLVGGGYRLVQSEWRHARFFPATGRTPARSQVAVVLHVIDEGNDRRIIVHGELAVEWSDRRDGSGNPIPAKIDATNLRMLARPGPPAFEPILTYRRPVPGGLSGIHPILLYDLDKDGLPEVVMVRDSRVLWNQGAGGFDKTRLFADPNALTETVLTETGVIADMNGDAHPDLLSTRVRGDLVLYLGDGKGRFRGEAESSTRFDPPLRAPSALTVGDVDADGDLDVWLAQYKPPYIDGQMPSPYYDANDGHPAYLLLNDGEGNLSPVTTAAGLAEKRFRRTYASALVDLDVDGDLDLLVISDFSGIDLYHNDGDGHFVDANDTLRADLGDYDLDGRLDFFVAGMASTTARRLEALGLGRADRPEIQAMRMRMAFGNRMYLAADGGWREPEFRAQVARTGWTWGTTAFDFDNDGDPDIFAANGNESGESTKDYCVNFWCHDIYDGESEPNEALSLLFEERSRGVLTGRESWDGYQKNHLLMNLRGKQFIDVAFLLGVAGEFDSRSAVSADFDLDGRVDLFVVEDLGLKGQKLHIYRNQLETEASWVGIQLREQGQGISPVGASAVVRAAGRTQVGRVVTGETLMGQHSTTLHFGLGGATSVDSLEVRWVNGMKRVIRDPEINRYHLVSAPGGDRSESRISAP
jgi:hypothetical protein